MPGETASHLNLKRLALAWAQHRGFRIAAAEVSIPQFGFRLDAAAYRPKSTKREDPKSKRQRSAPTVGVTAIFECKQTRADFLRDSRCAAELSKRLAQLYATREVYEASMQVHFPSLRNGESLFPEFDGYRFAAAGFEPYEKLTDEIRRLACRLHQQTKFDKLARWQAANLHFVVAEEGTVRTHELPFGWGLLLRRGEELEIAAESIWQETPEEHRFALLLRIAMSGTRAVNRSFAIDLATGGAKEVDRLAIAAAE